MTSGSSSGWDCVTTGPAGIRGRGDGYGRIDSGGTILLQNCCRDQAMGNGNETVVDSLRR